MAKKDINKEKNKNNFFKDLKSELKKVTWPTFKKLVNNTSAVISIVLIMAVIVFALDLFFENLNKFSVEKLKSLVSTSEETQVEEITDSDENTDENVELDENTEVESEDITETIENGQELEVETEVSPEEVDQ